MTKKTKKMREEELAQIDDSAKALLNAMELASAALPPDPRVPKWVNEAIAESGLPTFMPHMGRAIRGGLRLHRRISEARMETGIELSVDIHGDYDEDATPVELLTRVDLHSSGGSLTISEGLAITDAYMRVLSSAARAEMLLSDALRRINHHHREKPRLVLRRAVELQEELEEQYHKVCDKHRPVRSAE